MGVLRVLLLAGRPAHRLPAGTPRLVFDMIRRRILRTPNIDEAEELLSKGSVLLLEW
jgi:hypothetical protein